MQQILSFAPVHVAERVTKRLGARGLDRVWLHVDLDVLDQTVMPAARRRNGGWLRCLEPAHAIRHGAVGDPR